MPELPEVETTVNGLNATVRGRKILGVWTDYKKHKIPASFKKLVVGKTILNTERRAKNILMHLSGGYTILTHMKLTGYYSFDPPKGTKFLRLIFKLDKNHTLALSDLRRFAKVVVIKTKDLAKSFHLAGIGPEPLDKQFEFTNFKLRINTKPRGKIKTVLMDQSVIAGIGNIYSDEILWRAGIHPISIVAKIPEKNMREMFKAMKVTLKRGIDFGGDSMSDYFNIYGEKGRFQEHHRAYQRTGEKCGKDKGVIKRLVVAGRSAHFCPIHQKLLK